jgi:GNAT superfamily N-acetyltransferase
MKILAANNSHKYEVLVMLKKFWTKAVPDIPFDPVTAEESYEVINALGMMFVAYDESDDVVAGVIGGLMVPSFANKKYVTGVELFYWVEPEYRRTTIGGELLDIIEMTAKVRGIHSWSMISLTTLNHDVVAELYKRRGYTHTETAFTKVL